MDDKEKAEFETFIKNNLNLKTFLEVNNYSLIDLILYINAELSYSFSDSIVCLDDIFKINNGVLSINRETSPESQARAFVEIKEVGQSVFESNLDSIKDLLKDKTIFGDYNITDIETIGTAYITRLLLSEALLNAELYCQLNINSQDNN